jgi:hypothetical protein
VTGWADIRAAWSQGWKALQARAASTYAAALQADPSGTAARVQGFVAALEQARASLDRIAARLPAQGHTEADRAWLSRYQDLERRWRDLAAGLLADATPASTPAVGMAPALAVGGLAVTAVGLAWAVVAYEYALNLNEQTALAERELEARVAASAAGRALPPSTLPPAPPSLAAGARNLGLWLLGGLVVAAGALAVPLWMERR